MIQWIVEVVCEKDSEAVGDAACTIRPSASETRLKAGKAHCIRYYPQLVFPSARALLGVMQGRVSLKYGAYLLYIAEH